MVYEWDETKRAKNLAIHGADFSAIESFEWEDAIVEVDTRRNYGETRYAALWRDKAPFVCCGVHPTRSELPHHQSTEGQPERD